LWVKNSKAAAAGWIANSKSGEIERTCRLAISYQIGDRKLEVGRGEIEHTYSLALASSYQIADRTCGLPLSYLVSDRKLEGRRARALPSSSYGCISYQISHMQSSC
jgi:hypothetical protein